MKKLLNYAKKNKVGSHSILKMYEFVGDDDISYPAIAEIDLKGSKYVIVRDLYIIKGIIKDTLNEWTQKDIESTFFCCCY